MKLPLKPSQLLGIFLAIALLAMTWVIWESNRTQTLRNVQEEFQYRANESGQEMAHHFQHLQTLIQHIQALQTGYSAMEPKRLQQVVQTHLEEESLSNLADATIIPNDKQALQQSHVCTDSALQSSAVSGLTELTDRLNSPHEGGATGAPYALVGALYSKDTTHANAAGTKTVIGWVCLKFDAGAMVHKLVDDEPSEFGFDVFDSSTLSPAALVYRSVPEAELIGMRIDSIRWPLLRSELNMQLGGRQWVVVTYPRAAFLKRFNTDQANWMALLGGCASLLIGYLVFILGSSRENALLLVRQYTRDLQTANADLNAVLHAVPDLMFEVDLDGRYHQWWSPRHDLLAAPPEFFLGKRIAEILPPEASAVCYEVLLECNSMGYSVGSQIQLEIAGQLKWFELSAARKESASGAPHFILLSRDITSRKLAELATNESERQLFLALQGGELGFWDWDVKSGRLQVNARWYTMLGLDPSQGGAGIALWDSLIHPADREKLLPLVKASFRQPERAEFTSEVRVRHALGHYVWILDKGTVFTRDADGKPLRVIGTHMDITARKLDEERLRLNEYAFKAITQGICITDLQGTATSVNEAFCDITGYSRSEILGKNCRMLQGTGTDKTTTANIRQALQTNTVFTGEILNYKKNGQPFWNDLEIAPVHSTDNEVTHFVGITKDISEKKKADLIIAVERNAIRISTEQLRILSRRLLEVQETERRRVAHELHDELGQSLTAIKINLLTSQSRQGVPPSAIDLENVRIVEDALQQVRRISLALRPSMLDDLGLKAALAWLTKAASVNRDIAVEFQCNMDQPRLPGGVETACFRIVQEALTNVRRHAQATHVAVRLEVLAHQLKLEVADNGVGYLAPSGEDAEAEPSLGLLGMKERAASIGGTITVRSVTDQGTTVELQCRLPDTEISNA